MLHSELTTGPMCQQASKIKFLGKDLQELHKLLLKEVFCPRTYNSKDTYKSKHSKMLTITEFKWW